MANRRQISNMTHLFAGLSHGSPPGVGYPYSLQMEGTPTAPEYYEKPPKWNVMLPPVFLMEFLRQAWEWLSGG